jgi:PKD repeat protein
MRTTTLALITALAAGTLAGCTVTDVDTPPLAGPSSFSRSILMQANKDTLQQDGFDEAAITLTALVQPGQSENISLRAQVFVDGVAQDFGTLSTKNPITPTTLLYRAPAAPSNPAGQVPTTVTIAVTPVDSGDFRAEVARTIDIRLVPPGVILPSNPNLAARFTFAPLTPQVLNTVTFDASTTTNGGSACLSACTYAWSFGDGTTGSGITLTHQFRTVGSFPVSLTVTDIRGASATTSQTVPVSPGTPPTASFTTSPATPGVDQDIFFNASASTPAAGRSIVSYDWTFGDGASGTGVLTRHSYSGAGNYTVQLAATDDAGSIGRSTASLQVGPTVGALPTADLTFLPAAPQPNQAVRFDASGSRPGSGATIVSYTFSWGDGSDDEVTTNPIQSHTYNPAGTYVATVTVRDSLGRTATAQVEVEVETP